MITILLITRLESSADVPIASLKQYIQCIDYSIQVQVAVAKIQYSDMWAFAGETRHGFTTKASRGSLRQRGLIFCLKKTLNASKPSEHPPNRGGKMSKCLSGIIGCEDETSRWHLIGFSDGSNIGSRV